MRTFRGVTVDTYGATDLDDAFWVEDDGRGGYLVQVAFPRVSAAFDVGDEVDDLAMSNGFTHYREGDGWRGMLPGKVATVLGLKQGVPGEVFLVSIPVSRHFVPGEPSMTRAVYRGRARMNYRQATKCLREPGSFHVLMRTADEVARGLLARRLAAGAVAGREVSPGMVTGEDGNAVRVDPATYPAQAIVGEFMILANSSLAIACASHKLPLLYRNQVTHGPARGTAYLSTSSVGHSSVGVSAYAWFTSPIRRYADVVNQRVLEDAILGRPPRHGKQDVQAIAVGLNHAYREESLVVRVVDGPSDGSASSSGSPERFRRSLASALRQRLIPRAMLVEASARLRSGTLGAEEATDLLLRGGDVAQAAVDALTDAPHAATPILDYGRASLGWTVVATDYVARPSDCPWHGASVTVTRGDESHASGITWAPTSREARRCAAVIAIARLFGATPPQPVPMRGHGPGSSEEGPDDAVPVVDVEREAVRLCRAGGWSAPDVDVRRVGGGPRYEAVAYAARDGERVETPAALSGSRERASHVALHDLCGILAAMPARGAAPRASRERDVSERIAALCGTMGWDVPDARVDEMESSRGVAYRAIARFRHGDVVLASSARQSPVRKVAARMALEEMETMLLALASDASAEAVEEAYAAPCP